MVTRRSRFVRRSNDWAASWIWCDGESRPRNFFLHARKAFKLSAKPESASLRITADSRYKLFINGNFVGRGPVSSDPRRLSYDTYDIASFLVKGQNVIAVLVHHLGQGTYSYIPGRAGLICEAKIEWEGGSEQIVTDESWRVLPSPGFTSVGGRMNRRIGFQEVFDASQEAEGWTPVKFKDAKWPEAKVIGKASMPPFDRLVSRQIPHLREEIVHPSSIVSMHVCPALPENLDIRNVPSFMATEELVELDPKKVTKPERLLSDKDDAATFKLSPTENMSVILDFGREVFGCVELVFAKSNGGTVDIGYSELLEDERVKPNKDEVRYSDRVILRKGKQTWCSFEPRAFRYMQIDLRNCPKPVGISNVLVRETGYPVEWLGSFECDDINLNKIWKTAAETVRLSMQDTFIDSPWRERAQWWDNATMAARVAYYVFGDTKLAEQGIRHIAASQHGDGSVSALYPSATREIFPDFGAIWVMSIWECYARNEDNSFLSDIYPAVARWLKWIALFTDKDGLLANVKGNLFIDWAEIDRRGEVCALNCLYLGALRAAGRMAEALRKRADVEEWAGIASSLRMAIPKFFWSRERGLFADARVAGKLEEHYSKQTNILAALFDVPDHYQKASIYRQAIDEKCLQPIITPNFMSMLVESLFRSGDSIQAVELIRKKWGQMLHEGATTFWEYFDTSGSLCYAASSGPAYQLPEYILGVKSTGEVKRIVIEPHPADLSWAKGTVPTAHGLVNVDWQITKRGFSMTVEIPRGVTAEVIPPKEYGPCRVLANGRDRHDRHVELNGGTHVIQVLRGIQAKKYERRSKVVIEEPKAVDLTVVPPGRADIETVEQMIKILAELEAEAALAAAAAEAAAEQAEQAEQVPDKRKRRRRGKRGRGAGVAQEAETAVVSENGEEIAETAVEVVAEGQPEGEKSNSKRRRRRGKSQVPAQQEESAVAVQVEEKVEAEAAVEAAPERRKPSRRHRRHSPRPEEAVAVAEEVKEASIAPVETVVEAASERRKPSRRRKRQPAHAEAHVEATTAAEEVHLQAVAPAQAPQTEAEPKPKRPRRTRNTKAAVEQSAQAVVEAPVAHVEAPAKPPTEKPKPTTRRRTAKAKVEVEPTPSIEVVREHPAPMVEAPVEVAADVKKAVRRRRTPTKAATATVEAPVKSVVIETAPAETIEPSNGNGKNPKRAPRKPRKAVSKDSGVGGQESGTE